MLAEPAAAPAMISARKKAVLTPSAIQSACRQRGLVRLFRTGAMIIVATGHPQRIMEASCACEPPLSRLSTLTGLCRRGQGGHPGWVSATVAPLWGD